MLARAAARRRCATRGLLDETSVIAAQLDPAALAAFLDRLGRAGVLLAGNVAPELVLDDLALAWPQPTACRRS